MIAPVGMLMAATSPGFTPSSSSVPWWVALVMLIIAAIPLVMTLINLRLYRKPPSDAQLDNDRGWLGVCIPARNEQDNIEACVRSVLAQDDDRVRVYVYDDQSTDETPAILARLRDDDERVRAVAQVPLPDGWNGKQHGCWRAARAAIEDGCAWLLFTDADVRFAPDMARKARASAQRLDQGHKKGRPPLGVLSTFPKQITRTLGEALQVPMMFYLLLGYLPMFKMRASPLDQKASAACGQFILVSAECYQTFGGHAAFKGSMHDGVKLPKAARAAGYTSDLFDGSRLASVRMYRGFAQAWRGFAKNAYEGLGSPALLVFLTAIHVIGHLGPWVALVLWATTPERSMATGALLAGAALAPIAQRLILAARLGHSPAGAILHPVAIVLMVAVQWWSLVLHLSGRRSWRGRVAGRAPSQAG